MNPEKGDIYKNGVDDVDYILENLFRIRIEKSLDPLDKKDFNKIVDRVARDLRKISRPIEERDIKKGEKPS